MRPLLIYPLKVSSKYSPLIFFLFSQTEPKRLKIDKQGEDLGPTKSKQKLAITSRSVTAQEPLCRDVEVAKPKPPVNMSYTVGKQCLGNYF